MKQILQNARTGSLELVDVPAPAVGEGQILVRNVYSVMSPGTEKMAMDFARKSMLGKARSRPDLVKQVARKLRQEGPLPTYRTVVNRLDAPQPLGYASAGIVEQVGEGVMAFAPGDRVACAGAGYANHAELIVVPENLTAAVPKNLSLDRAAFATLGAIAIQGIRVGDPTLGEVVAVIGLGLIGQLTVQLLLANGCRVYGIDLDPKRVAEAIDQGMDWGAAPGDDHGPRLHQATGGHGTDCAIVTAASDSSAPLQLAAELCRHKGRVIAVGATAMDLDRRTFYEKELELRMSMSYGPGRYDRRYEEVGLDYPIAYVRWTEQRNLQAFVDLAAKGSVDPKKMNVETVEFEVATETYEALAKGERRALAAVFRYAEDVDRGRVRSVALGNRRSLPAKTGDLGLAFIGAGNYGKAVLLPILEKTSGISRRIVVTSTGPSAQRTAERFGFESCGTDPNEVFQDDSVDLVFITTRHDSHATLSEAALRAGKAVWLEKPVGLTLKEVEAVSRAVDETEGFLMVGYNRRFSSHARAVREAFANRAGPMAIQYVVAAGPTPVATWLTDPKVGGGRVIGEMCHFVDLCTYLVGDTPIGVQARALGRDPESDDSVMALYSYADGSTANISYLANASAELPKERWEVHADGRSAVCDNFRVTTLPGGKKVRGVNQDKGQGSAVASCCRALTEGLGPVMPVHESIGATLACLATLESMSSADLVGIGRDVSSSDQGVGPR
jgi:predicted dehydrogenase/threonine dehydrogenase-like Zn-dependent dehydrogenase